MIEKAPQVRARRARTLCGKPLAGFFQTLAELSRERRVARSAVEKPDHRHRRLLRARRERPRCSRAAECGQQFPPSDGDVIRPSRARCVKATIPRQERAVLTAVAPGAGEAARRAPAPMDRRLGHAPAGFKSCLICPRKRTSAPHHGLSHECQSTDATR